MNNSQKHFVVNNNIPDFISRDHELFEAFSGAYYEWLELQNDSENTNYSDLFKGVGNPGYIVDHQEQIVDIDESLDSFIDFFANTIVPISLDGIQTDPRFFLKKVRDLYLAKGTIKSFKLFFKLYYNDNIEVFETRDTILRASAGKFFAFPTAFFYISDFEESLDRIDFTLAQITDSDGVVLSTILEGGTVGKTKLSETIIRTQFSNEVTLKQNVPYYIKNADDNYRIQVKALVSLSELRMTKGGSLYTEKDPIFVDSISLGNRFTGSIKSTSKGTVSGLKIRNRGVHYTVGDYLRIYQDDVDGQVITITETGNVGDIKSLNNYPVRTGILNNGFEGGILEDTFIPVDGTGVWSELPDLRYTNSQNFSTSVGMPYIKATDSGVGLQAIPVSRTIGVANFASLDQETFFRDSDDVLINAPLTVIVENNNLKKGDKVAFQYFGNDANYHPRRDDSERLLLRYNFTRIYESGKNTPYKHLDSEVQRSINYPIPYGYDSELFKWKFKNVDLNTRTKGTDFWNEVTNLLDSEGNINYKLNSFGYDNKIVDGGFFSAIFYVTVYHSEDIAGNVVNTTQTETIPYSNDGTIQNIVNKTHTFLSNKDSEVFDLFKSFQAANHRGNINIQTDVMKYNEPLDGGPSFNYTLDSELDGGVIGEYYAEIKDGWNRFDVGDQFVSVMRVEFPDWHPDSEIFNYQSFTEDSDDITDVFDGGDFFGFAGARTEVLEIEYEGHYLQSLESIHLNSIDSEGTGLDSDVIKLDYMILNHEPRILDNNEDSDVGNWVDTGHYGEVIGIGGNNKVVKIISYNNAPLPTQAEIDRYSEEKYNIVKLAKMKNGVSDKDHSLVLDNVVHQVDRIEFEYKTAVVSSLFQKFYNQDGFISSDFGGHIPDNYYYSDWSYRIRSQLPLQVWKEKFKTMLHPAGMVMTTDYSLNTQADIGLGDVSSYISDNFKACLTFDKQQEFLDLSLVDPNITADNIYYKSNAFEAENIIDGTATALNAASLTSVANVGIKQQNGNAWWDYEPVGLVKNIIDSEVDLLYKSFKGTYLNWDSEALRNRQTTQDSDGNGLVKNDYTYYKYFDGSRQDLYKTQSRVANHRRNLMVSKVQFEDAGLNTYVVYDSEVPDDFFTDFNDSCYQNTFKAIDYQRLKSDSDNRYFSMFKIPRAQEIALFKERDLATAMREDGSLRFVDSDKTYVDYEAYERKWNAINTQRTRNNEGWTVKGYLQYEAHESIEQRSKKRSKYGFNKADIVKYTQAIAPRNIDSLEQDTLIWHRSYYDQINTKSIDRKYEKETYKDPQVGMRYRRGR